MRVGPADGPGNRELIGQTIANLLDNALKYGAPNRGLADAETKPDVVIAAERIGGSVEIDDRRPWSRHRAGRPRRGCSAGSSGSKAPARGPARASACRWPRRSRACMAARSRLRTMRPDFASASLCRAADPPAVPAPAELVMNERTLADGLIARPASARPPKPGAGSLRSSKRRTPRISPRTRSRPDARCAARPRRSLALPLVAGRRGSGAACRGSWPSPPDESLDASSRRSASGATTTRPN